MTAGVGNAVYLDANDSAGSGIGREVRSQLCKFCICLGNHLALAVEPDSSRVAVKGTELDTPRRERTGILGSTKPLKLDTLQFLAQRWDSPQATSGMPYPSWISPSSFLG